MPTMRWALFCRVIDNFGDIGVCWRLAADLGARGEQVRLWVDDASALAWMAPHGAANVTVAAWHEAAAAEAGGGAAELADVVVEAFGCDPPPAFVSGMARRETPPVWINLEYLSAEPYVRRSHGLCSPQLAGPGRGLRKWFFYPGFDAGSGGLLRETGLMRERHRFDAPAWLRARGLDPAPHERVVSLFCYPGAPLPALAQWLDAAPTLLLHPQGVTPPRPASPRLRCVALPWLSQPDYDRLLWSCELNFVRGEDSFVRAQWAGVPFVWQIYPQHDAAHAAKLDAFLDRMLDGAGLAAATALRRLWRAWNGLGDAAQVHLPAAAPWRELVLRWRTQLLAQPDLTSALLGFAAAKR
jgi:uncharacterized repeat protein (TIGR03837 family)